MKNKSNKFEKHHIFPKYLSPYLILYSILLVMFLLLTTIIFEPTMKKYIILPLMITNLYFLAFNLYITIVGVASRKANSTIRYASVMTTINSFSFFLSLVITQFRFLTSIPQSYPKTVIHLLEVIVYLPFSSLVFMIFALSSPLVFNQFSSLEISNINHIVSSITVPLETYLLMTGRTYINANNEIQAIDKYKGSDHSEIIVKIKESKYWNDFRVITYFKDYIKLIFITLVYLIVSGTIFIPLIFGLILSIFFAFLSPVLILSYISAAYVGGYVYISVNSKSPIDQNYTRISLSEAYVIAMATVVKGKIFLGISLLNTIIVILFQFILLNNFLIKILLIAFSLYNIVLFYAFIHVLRLIADDLIIVAYQM